MTLSLNTTIIEPEKSSKINNAIILFHGDGGDGKDFYLIQFFYVPMDTRHVQ